MSAQSFGRVVAISNFGPWSKANQIAAATGLRGVAPSSWQSVQEVPAHFHPIRTSAAKSLFAFTGGHRLMRWRTPSQTGVGLPPPDPCSRRQRRANARTAEMAASRVGPYAITPGMDSDVGPPTAVVLLSPVLLCASQAHAPEAPRPADPSDGPFLARPPKIQPSPKTESRTFVEIFRKIDRMFSAPYAFSPPISVRKSKCRAVTLKLKDGLRLSTDPSGIEISHGKRRAFTHLNTRRPDRTNARSPQTGWRR